MENEDYNLAVTALFASVLATEYDNEYSTQFDSGVAEVEWSGVEDSLEGIAEEEYARIRAENQRNDSRLNI